MKKKFLRLNSAIIASIFILVISLNIFDIKHVHAEGQTLTTEVKPKINVNYLGVTPESPMVGQDFTVRYEIVPEPFYHNVSKPKEIVLVLDKSGSMGDNNKMKNLKMAAKKFINSLTAINEDGVPKITNLKIGIIAYDSNGNIEKELLEVTSSISINTSNIRQLNAIIDSLDANGGTNIGDGLRKGAYLLDSSSSKDANKTIIFMADGEPTYYSGKSNNDKSYYTVLDRNEVGTKNKSVPYRYGTGNSDTNKECLDYATTIGNLIKERKYNVFSIGYGLGSENSSANQKMKKIHESMGGVSSGENSTFFATDSGAIESVFEKISDVLEKSYAFNDVNLNLNLASSITAVNGFDIVDNNNNIVKIDPIVYEIDKNTNQYTAKTQIVEFTVRANAEGNINLFDNGSNINYTDIYGNEQSYSIQSPTIVIRPFVADEAEKLGIDFRSLLDGYLIGDTITTKVTMIHSGVSGVNYSNAKFILNESTLPSNIRLLNGTNNELNFGVVNTTDNKDYKLTVGDDTEITIDDGKSYSITGNYSYNLKKGNSSTIEDGEREATINVKRGEIKVKVKDEAGNDITQYSTISMSSTINGEKITGALQGGYITFNTIPSGNHTVSIENLPQGCEAQENEGTKVMRIDYNNNVGEYVFNVKGRYNDGGDIPNITAKLKSHKEVEAKPGDEIEVKYTIEPEDFEYYSNNSESVLGKTEEVVFIVDRSNGMTGNQRESFFTNGFNNVIKNKMDIKVGFVAYSDVVNYTSNKLLHAKNEINSIEQILNNGDFNTNKNTNTRNIKEALLEADRILQSNGDSNKNKAIVLVNSDGIIYNESDISFIKNKGYKFITLDLSNPNNIGKNNLQTLHCLLTGKDNANEECGYFIGTHNDKQEQNGVVTGFNFNSVNSDMQKIADYLDRDVSGNNQYLFNDVKLQFDLAGNFIPINNTLKPEGTNYKLEIDPIVYTPNSTPNANGLYTYTSPSFEVSFTIQINDDKLGRLTFGEENTISYSKVNGISTSGQIDTPTILVEEADSNSSVKIKISDSSGVIPDVYDSSENDLNYHVDNSGEVYKLYGKSNVEINFSGKDITHLRYKFVKEDTDTNDTEWRYISAEGDIDTKNQGYLTQMPYDVSHMDLLSNNEKWSNRQEVFKTKFESETAPISMEVSPAHSHGYNCKNDANHYVTSKTMINELGQTVTRWVPKTLFVENHNVDSYANGYKEASKTWGYIKVPTSGEYWFQTWADDGFYGAITVDGEAKVFGDDFRPRGSSAINAKESIYLEADKYYPIYLEYFNWGGSADYRIMYSVGNKDKYELVDKNWFYPSNSDSPTDNSNSIFMGGSIVDFETEPGIYTIQYEVGKLEGEVFTTTSVGSFSKFEVEERFELEKSLSVTDIDRDEEFDIIYNIKPKPIELTDLYKVNANDIKSIENIPATLTVENIELRDTISSGISLIESNSDNIYSIKDRIEYRISGDQFIADEYKFVIRVKATSKDVSFDNETGEIHYRDISLVENLRISQKQVFSDKPELGVHDKSIITKHGLFLKKSVENGSVKVSNDMPYTFGFVIDAKGVNNSFTIEIPSDVKIDKSSATIYELDKDEKIISSIKETINGENISDSQISYENSNGFIKNGEKYAVVYKVKKINNNSTIRAKLTTGSEKSLNLTTSKLPDLF